MTQLGNRQFDVFMLGDSYSGLLDLQVSDDANVAYGPAVAVQKFLAVLLSRKGSDPLNTASGTSFLAYKDSGKLRTEPLVTMLFSSSAHDAVSQLESARRADSPDDEEVQRVEIESVQVTADTVTIVANLVTLAGSTFEFTVPFRLGTE